MQTFKALLILTLFSACALTGCQNLAGTQSPNPAMQAPLAQFTSSAANIRVGQLVTLTWKTQNATEVRISPPVIDKDDGALLAVSGSAGVALKHTTTFVLTASNAAGRVTRQVTITVEQPLPTIVLAAEPPAVLAGGSAELRWASTDATSITIDSGVGAVAPPAGSLMVSPAATTVYTATATGPGGTAITSHTVSVSAEGEFVLFLSADPATIELGANTTLKWQSQGASTVGFDQGIGAVAPNGSLQLQPSATTTYTAVASSASGATKTASVVVTVRPGAPGVGLNKLRHIIFFIQENRSFDTYLGMLGRYREARGLPNDIDGIPLDHAMPDLAGHLVKPFHQRSVVTENLSPSWNESHYDLHEVNGTYLMDQFMLTSGSIAQLYDPHGTRAVGYYDETDIPYYYELATQFATSDRFFSSVLCGTLCNRLYLFSATTAGLNDPTDDFPGDIATIFRLLSQAGITWRYYYQDDSVFLGYYGADWAAYAEHVWPIENYYEILTRGSADADLPQVVFIQHAARLELDEHPGNDVQKGVALAEKLIGALMRSAAWPSSALILSHDEGGGLYDHVPPMAVVNPDGVSPMFASTDIGRNDDFTLSGFRVPLIVVSPYAKKSFVSHVPREFTSILKLIETRFNLGPLTRRDAAADDMSELFDFDTPPWLTPPILPQQPIDCPGTMVTPRCDPRYAVAPNHVIAGEPLP